jgi:hypothetical protein
MQNPIGLIRQLKGAPLSCYIALVIVHQPVTIEWLSRVTGYTDKPVTAAMNYLQELGIAGRISLKGGFFLQDDFMQLQLNDRNYSDDIPTTATATIVEKKKLRSAAAEEVRNNSDVYLKLKKAGVGEPTLSLLASDPQITPEVVDLQIRNQKNSGASVGLLIHRLRSHDEIQHPKHCQCHQCRHQYADGWLKD